MKRQTMGAAVFSLAVLWTLFFFVPVVSMNTGPCAFDPRYADYASLSFRILDFGATYVGMGWTHSNYQWQVGTPSCW